MKSDDVPVDLRGLGKDYGSFTALKSLDLDVPQGTSLGFLGPNGAGKTTTFYMVVGLVRPNAGRHRDCIFQVIFQCPDAFTLQITHRDLLLYLDD